MKAKWIILASYSILVALNQFLWINFASISTQVQSFYGVSAFEVALLAIIFPLIYIIFSIPAGFIVDKKGYKYSILIASILMFLFALIRAIQINYIFLLIGQIGIAFAQPFLNNSVSKLANTEFKMNEVTLAIGIGTLAIFIGVSVGMIVPPLIIQYISVSEMLYIFSIVSLIAMLFYIISMKYAKKIEMPEKTELHISKVLKYREVLVLSYVAFVGMGIFNGILTWIDSIFQHISLSMLQAGEIGLIFLVGGIFGSYFNPMLSSKYKQRKIFVIIAIIVSIIILSVYAFVSNFIILIILSFVFGFFLLGAFPLIIDWATVITGSKYAGSATSIIWLLGQTGGFIIPLFMGYNLLTMPNNTYLYSYIIFIILILSGLILLLKIHEKRTFVSP
ncbi:MAG: MFS transporter [Thermoplasmata archaeon]